MIDLSAEQELSELIRHAVAEDLGDGDWTTRWTIPAGDQSRARIVAKEPLILSGLDVARQVFLTVDPTLTVEVKLEEGTAVGVEEVVARVGGETGAILTAERTALNFLGHLSGIASVTRKYVDRVAGTGARIVDTRKTSPGMRRLEKMAVRAGGGINHRMGLFDMVLIKDNHIAAAGGVREAIESVKRLNRRGFHVEVEVSDLAQLEAALSAGVDRVLLDNMTPAQLKEAVDFARSFANPCPLLEASGNVRLETVRTVAETGIDLISVGALTHSAPVADLSLRIERD